MKKAFVIAPAAVVAALSLAAAAATAPGQTTSLTVYSGREQALVKPIMDRFAKETGIQLNVRYASSTALASPVHDVSIRPIRFETSGGSSFVFRRRRSARCPRGLRHRAVAGSARVGARACSCTTRTSCRRTSSPRRSGV